jgi:hypothetical protein
MTNQAPFIKQTLFEFSHLAHDPWSMNLGNGAAGESLLTRIIVKRFTQIARSPVSGSA